MERIEEENSDTSSTQRKSSTEEAIPKSTPTTTPKSHVVHFEFLLNDESGNVEIDDEKEPIHEAELMVTGKVFKGKKIHHERPVHGLSRSSAKSYGVVPRTPPPFSTAAPQHDPKSVSHPKGTHFRDQKRKIDYVLVYEQHSRYKNIAHTIHNLRQLVRQADAQKYSKEDFQELDVDSEIDQRREFFLSQLMKSGLELEMHEYTDADKKLVFVKIHAPWSVLSREAQRLRMKLPLLIENQPVGEQKSFAMKLWDAECLRDNNEDFDDPPSRFGDRIMWPFSSEQIHRFHLPENPENLFTPCQRSEIVWEAMQLARNDPLKEKRRGIESLLEHHIIDAAFPLHDGDYLIQPCTDKSELTTRQRLHVEWATVKRLLYPQPLTRVRNYFSEKVAFYFAFMDFYTKMLIIPSVVGLIIFIYGLMASWTAAYFELEEICDKEKEPGSYIMCPICQPPACEPYLLADEGCHHIFWQYRLDNMMTIVSGGFGVLWCAFFAKFWRRREARLAAEWGTHDVEESTRTVRPHYEKMATKQKINPVTGESEPYLQLKDQILRKSASTLITFALLCTACLCLVALIVGRIFMYGLLKQLGSVFVEYNIDIARWFQHFLIFLMLTVFELMYHHVAHHLTKIECPKTSAAFSFSLLWKIFIFVELVDFLPIAYLAWFKGRGSAPNKLSMTTELCEAGGCVNEVLEVVATLLLLRLIVQNVAEVGIPALKTAFSRCKTERRGAKRDRLSSMANGQCWSQFLKDYQLGEMHVSSEFMEMMIQFSFVAFYMPALPLVPLLCFINNIFEIRIDAINALATHRRPCPTRVPGIEIWNRFIDILVKVAVLVNAALFAFTSEIVPWIVHDFQFPGNNTFASYVSSSMSWQSIDEWPQMQDYVREHSHNTNHDEAGEHDFLSNLTQCAYFGYRSPRLPHNATLLFYQILSARAFAFIVFVVLFYCLIYLIDTFIDDVPEDAKNKVKRQQFIVMKTLEQDAYRRRVSKHFQVDIE